MVLDVMHVSNRALLVEVFLLLCRNRCMVEICKFLSFCAMSYTGQGWFYYILFDLSLTLHGVFFSSDGNVDTTGRVAPCICLCLLCRARV